VLERAPWTLWGVRRLGSILRNSTELVLNSGARLTSPWTRQLKLAHGRQVLYLTGRSTPRTVRSYPQYQLCPTDVRGTDTDIVEDMYAAGVVYP
jgi:hypothetical protein